MRTSPTKRTRAEGVVIEHGGTKEAARLTRACQCTHESAPSARLDGDTSGVRGGSAVRASSSSVEERRPVPGHRGGELNQRCWGS